MIKVVVFCTLCITVYFLYPYALFTPEQRYLRSKCTIGEVCILPEDQKVATEKFTAHEPKIAHFIYEDSADLNETTIGEFDQMFGPDVWKVARKLIRTNHEVVHGPETYYPIVVEYWKKDRLMWRKNISSTQILQENEDQPHQLLTDSNLTEPK